MHNTQVCVASQCDSLFIKKKKKWQVKQLDQLERYTTPQRDATATDDGELGELSEKFYQAAVQVCVCVCV